MFYEDLIKYPGGELMKACNFLRRGDLEWGMKAIDKKLNKSKPIRSKSKEFKMIKEFFADIRHNCPIKKYNLKNLRERIKKIDKSQIVKFVK